jgi:Tfp pilus assembly protein PilZ
LGVDIERRKHKRYQYEAIISHDILSQDAAPDGKMHNFSKNGLYFESNHSFYTGEDIFLEILDHPQSEKGIELLFDVEIVWRKKPQNSSFLYGYDAQFNYSHESIENTIGTGIPPKRKPGPQKPDSKDPTDARKDPRKRCHKPLVFKYDNSHCRGLLTNISRGGAFIKTKTKMSLGHKIKFVISGSQIRKNIELKGWVVRLAPEGFAVSFNRRSGSERRYDIDRRIGSDRRKRRQPGKPQ